MAKIDKQSIIQAAANIADKEGLNKLTLKGLAQMLNIRSPSLYNHIQGLDDLRTSLMLYGWTQLSEAIAKSAHGKLEDNAVRAMCNSYYDYARLHPGVFEAMMWYNQHSSQEAAQATEELAKLIAFILSAYNLEEDEKIHASRMFRSFLQGFCSIANNNSFADPVSIRKSFDFAVETLINGLVNAK